MGLWCSIEYIPDHATKCPREDLLLPGECVPSWAVQNRAPSAGPLVFSRAPEGDVLS